MTAVLASCFLCGSRLLPARPTHALQTCFYCYFIVDYSVLASYFLCGSRLLPARPHALQAFNVCLLFNIYPINLDRISVACSSGLPLLDRSKLLPALRCSRLFLKKISPGGHCCTRSVNPQRYFGRPIKR